jgi:hypothetical protein
MATDYFPDCGDAFLFSSSLFCLRRCLRVATLFALFILDNIPESALSVTSGFIAEDLDEPGKGAVKGLLYLGGKDAAGKLVELEVEGNALAALALSGAGLVGTGTFRFV